MMEPVYEDTGPVYRASPVNRAAAWVVLAATAAVALWAILTAGGASTKAAELLAENQRMERLVDDLLFLARSDEGRAAAPGAPVDLNLVVAELGRLRARSRLRFDMSRVSAGRVVGHAERLGRVIRNLLENAERHARSLITVELGPCDDEVQLVVADDGPGVPPGQRERIFDRFVRLDEARGRHGNGGAGLGLSIAREIVRAHGGRLWVEDAGSAPGTGARFVVRLPAG